MTKSLEAGENEISREAKRQAARTGGDVCDPGQDASTGAKGRRQGPGSENHPRQEVSWLPQRAETEKQVMRWYAAHIVMAVQLKNGKQIRFPVWENILLVAAATEDAAFAKAEAHGRAEEGDDGGTFRWGGKPARWVFAGVRKLTECVSPEERPGDGTEITFNELGVRFGESGGRFRGRPAGGSSVQRSHPGGEERENSGAGEASETEAGVMSPQDRAWPPGRCGGERALEPG
jgi:hypothetical protein